MVKGNFSHKNHLFQAGFEIIHHRDAMEATPEGPLPAGWERMCQEFEFS